MATDIYPRKTDAIGFINEMETKLKHIKSLIKGGLPFKENDLCYSYSVDVSRNKNDKRATLLFSPEAWCKMRALVDYFTTEVEWHGVVKRNGDDSFIVQDILIFPQEATPATVTTVQEEYNEWQDSLDDSTFNSCKFHGHSHVNMSVTPSSLDLSKRKDIMEIVEYPSEQDQFYIFMITNKSMHTNVEIFDFTNNARYSNDEITVDVLFDNSRSLKPFLIQARDCVRTKSFNTSNIANNTIGKKDDYMQEFDWKRKVYGGY